MSNEFKYGDRLKAVLQKMEEQTKKVADFANVPFTPVTGLPEVSELTREMNDLWERDQITRKYLPAGIKELPFTPFPVMEKIAPTQSGFSLSDDGVLLSDVASLSYDIPSKYNHLLLYAFGQTDAAQYHDPILIQFNGDAGNNYHFADLYTVNNTLVGVENLGQPYGFEFDFSSASANANSASGGVVFFPHIQSSFWKAFHSLFSVEMQVAAAHQESGLSGSYWKDTSKITTIKFFPSVGAVIKAGSLFTLYGLI